MSQLNFDVLIVGSGLAGLTLALNLAQTKKSVLLPRERSLKVPVDGLRAVSRPHSLRKTHPISISETPSQLVQVYAMNRLPGMWLRMVRERLSG